MGNSLPALPPPPPPSHITLPRFTSIQSPTPTSTPGEDTPAFAIRVYTTRGATDTAYKTSLDWRRALRQGLLLKVGEILGSHWTAITRLKLGSPQPVRCCPATVCHPHWVHGDKGPPEKQTGTMAPGNHKHYFKKQQQQQNNSLKTGVLECVDNDDRPLRKSARHQGLQEDSCH